MSGSRQEPSLLVAARTTPTVLWNDSADPEELERSIGFGAVGATCNPVIALAVVRRRLGTWVPRIRALAEAHPRATESELGWLVVQELSVQAARLLEPAFAASGGTNGRLSVQTDPRLYRNAEALVDQAVAFSRLAPNVIVKIPAVAAGIEAIEEATFRGVSVNATVSFTVAQAVAVAEAVERGFTRRAEQGLTTDGFGSVCTIMGGRLDDWLKTWTTQQRILVDPAALEWAGVAVLKAAYRLYRERGYRIRLLSAAFRSHLQWSELVGGDLVVSPPFDWQLRINENRIRVRPHAIDEPVDATLLAALDGLAEFRRAADPEGLAVADFDRYGATVQTLRQFLDADAQLDALVRDVLLPL